MEERLFIAAMILTPINQSILKCKDVVSSCYGPQAGNLVNRSSIPEFPAVERGDIVSECWSGRVDGQGALSRLVFLELSLESLSLMF